MEDNCRTLGIAQQHSDGLFYIPDLQTRSQVIQLDKQDHNLCSAMLAVGKRDGTLKNEGKESSLFGEPSSPSKFKCMEKQMSSAFVKTQTKLWHERLGHTLSHSEISKQVKDGVLPVSSCRNIECENCAKGKYRRQFKGSLTNSSYIGILHTDTKGKVKVPSVDGHLYFLTIVEEFTRYVHVSPLYHKSEASEELLRFIKRFEKQSGHIIRAVHTDGGTEFNKALSFLDEQGVDTSITTAYTPQSNGLAERYHGIITSSARACLIQSKIPESFWNYAIRHVANCRNAVRLEAKNQIPYQAVFKRSTPYTKYLRPFGCRVLHQPVKNKLSTFASRANNSICLGHDKGGIYYVLSSSSKVVRTKHVRFIENEFPGMKYAHEIEDTGGHAADVVLVPDTQTYQLTPGDTPSDINPESPMMVDHLTYIPAVDDDDESSSNESNSENADPEVSSDAQHDIEDRDGKQVDSSEDINTEILPHSYSLRPRKQVDYALPALPRSITTTDEPTLSQAMQSPERPLWMAAIDEEFQTLSKNNSWTEEKETGSSNSPLPSGIILKVKRDEMGIPARFKARLVVRGNLQESSNHASDLYAPVACMELVRIMLSLSITREWCCDHIDIKGVFLHAMLPKTEEIFIKLPYIDGVSSANGQIVKLRKSLYGLKQAPRLWYDHLSSLLQKLGMRRCYIRVASRLSL